MEIKKVEIKLTNDYLVVNSFNKDGQQINSGDNKIKRFYFASGDEVLIGILCEMLHFEKPKLDLRYKSTSLIHNFFINTCFPAELSILDDGKNINVNYKAGNCWGLNKEIEGTIKTYPHSENGILKAISELPHSCAHIKEKYADENIYNEELELKKYIQLKTRQIESARKAKEDLYGLGK